MRVRRIYIAVLLALISLAVVSYFSWSDNFFSLSLLTAIIGTGALVVLFSEVKTLIRILTDSSRLLSPNKEKIDVALLPRLIEGNNQKFRIISQHIKDLGSPSAKAIDASLVNDEVGNALQVVQQQLKTLKEEEDRRHWITEGLAKFAELLRKKEDMNEYCAKVISGLVKYVGANQGALFLEHENEEGGRYLLLTGSYAYERRRYENKRVVPGEGLLGQCMYEKDIIFITDIPKDYVRITSGLGLATPRNIVVVPLVANEIFYGAVELASFQLLKPHQVEFLQQVTIMIAAEIGAIKTLENTKELLSESDELSHKLKANEEEMRMNMEELTTTQEEMRRHQSELERKQAELKSYLSAIDNTIASAEFNLAGDLTNANKLFLTLTGYSASDIKGKSYRQIFNNDESLQVMWENLQMGQFFSGEFRMRDNNGKPQWMNGTLNPILDSGGKPEKIMLFAQFTTQEKEKLNDLNGMLHAFKQAVPIVECGMDFQCKSANDKFMKMFDVNRLNLKHKKLCDFMPHKKFCEGFLSRADNLLNSNQLSMQVEFEIEGRIRTWEISVSPIKDLLGTTNRMVVMLIHEAEGRIVRLAI